jgi:hypothetical protein
VDIRAYRTLAVAACLAAAACGGGGGGGGGGGTRSLSGRVTYDFVPSTLAGTLVFSATAQKPVRNGEIQVMKGTTVLGTTTTDASGNYSLTFTESGTGQLQVVAVARTASPVIQVQDNTDQGSVWAIGAALGASTTTQDLHATHGWTGSSYDAATRTAAPFAILDSMYTAAKAFQAVRTVAFPDLAVNWSPNNVPGAGDPAQGQIGTSHFSPADNQIYILGKDGVDTDEFDSHVIVHEWGHYFEHNLSRSDSPGGPHGGGDVLDPRLSFGEGYGNALAAMLLPESVYVDTFWNQGGNLVAFGFDAETAPNPTDDQVPSAFSEATVMRLLYDIFDGGSNEAFDSVNAGLGVIYDVLTGPEKNTQALTTIGSFIAGLKAQGNINGAAVDTLLAHYNIGPITTEWGDGDAGLRDMYTDITAFPTPTSIALGGGFDFNKWQQNQYFVFTGNGQQVTVTATSAEAVALVVFTCPPPSLQCGTQVAAEDNTATGTATVQGPTANGAKYVVNLVGGIQGAGPPGDYQVNLNFTSP